MYSKSKIFLFSMLFFIGGVALRSLVILSDFWLWGGVGFCIMIFMVSFRYHQKSILGTLYVLLFLCGMGWYAWLTPDFFQLTSLVGKESIFEGMIVGDPIRQNKLQRMVVSLSEAPQERILIITKRYPEWGYGDTIRFSGVLTKPEKINNFDYPHYLAKEGIYFILPFPEIKLLQKGTSGFLSFLFALRVKSESHIQQALVFPYSAFVTGLLFGKDPEMPAAMKDDFIATGTSHVLALSGYNIIVIVLFVSSMLSFFFVSRSVVFWCSLFFIFLFVSMTGASSSVVRATIMGIMVMIGRMVGRHTISFPILIFTAFLMTLVNPQILIFDVSFQLSFCAVLGLIYVLPYLERKTKHIPAFFGCKELLLITLSAQVATLPLLIYYFHTFSLVAPLVNILIVPFIAPAMLFGFLVVIAGFISYPLSLLFAYPLWLITHYQLWVIHYFAQFQYSSFSF